MGRETSCLEIAAPARMCMLHGRHLIPWRRGRETHTFLGNNKTTLSPTCRQTLAQPPEAKSWTRTRELKSYENNAVASNSLSLCPLLWWRWSRLSLQYLTGWLERYPAANECPCFMNSTRYHERRAVKHIHFMETTKNSLSPTCRRTLARAHEGES